MIGSVRYSTLLFDLDHTLLDSVASEHAAFAAAMAAIGIDIPQPYFATYREINGGLWAAVERHEIRPDDVRVTRFERLIVHFRLDGDPVAMADAFVAGLGANGELYPGAIEVLTALSTRATLALVTNGIGQVQRTRIQRLGINRYFRTVAISGELGYSKPGTAIFEWVFDQLGAPSKSGALVIGDSLTSDMAGGVEFGIDTAWYNPSGRPSPGAPLVTHDLRSLEDLVAVATNGAVSE